MFEFFRRMREGHRLVTSLISGEFDQSPIGRELAAWFAERPERATQRNLFLGVALGMGGPRGIVANRLMDCIARVWKGDAKFGDLLSQQLDELIVFDPPKTSAQAELQRVALQRHQELKATLRSLDEAE